MISKEDMQGFLDKMLEIEMNMHNTYAGLAKKIKDEKIRKTFEMVSNQETEHAQMVKDLMKLLGSLK